MNKICVALFLLSIFTYSECQSKQAANDVVDDLEFKKKLIECQQFCVKQDPKRDSEQVCKVFEDKKLVLTQCEIDCLKLSKEEVDRASSCKCVAGKCVGNIEKNSAGSIIKFIPELFSLLFVICSLRFVF